MFETTVRDGVCRIARDETRWLSTGYAGGESHGPAAYNVTVPDGWPEMDLDEYIDERRQRAGFDDPGPTLLTGVEQRHAHRARLGPVEAVVTAGVSNPATLPLEPTDERGEPRSDDRPVGTINVVVGTTRSLAPGALPNLLTVVAEAKTATLLAKMGFTGTTTDAVIVACDPSGEEAAFSGSATGVGAATRACVRDALVASLDSRYAVGDVDLPESVAEAAYGVVTDERADVEPLD
ncbi:adenosylcobinamide hydrolase [Halogranum rubrum]|uniref:Adenosylcobinamide hydrolase n=1 Tax=Halogranum rubrum TaxID=553466 RepID=A0A1I4DWV4_9EURY|nr:adenosylcobinamide amidohydrolase [Halogranum rubrum]SFK98138.1 adenosylcobinamide hydrolase [Halogranum rubrum]